jgi:hypothetical protein
LAEGHGHQADDSTGPREVGGRPGPYNPEVMRPLRARHLVALEPSAVSGAVMAAGPGGARLRGYFRAPLPAGALVVSPAEPNLVDGQSVRAALQKVVDALSLRGQEVSVVLPGGLARPLLLDLPKGVSPEEFGRYRLTPTLPYPAEEALVEVTRIHPDTVIAAAVRRRVVLEYEAVVRDGGIRQERLDLAPLAALGALLRDVPDGPAAADVILGEAAVLFCAFKGGRLRGLRTRWRDSSADEPARLLADLERTAALAGANGDVSRVRLVGPGAGRLAAAWRDEGHAAAPGWSDAASAALVDVAELPWIGAGL